MFQLFLWALQLLRESLRLLEQILGAQAGLDRVEHDADGFAELVEEGLVDLAEQRELGDFNHCLDFVFEHDR